MAKVYTGYVKIARGLLDSTLWKDSSLALLLIYCLLRMTVRPYGMIQPGQFVTSKLQMAEDMGWNRATLKVHLRALEEKGYISVMTNARGCVISVIGWESYIQGHLPTRLCFDSPAESGDSMPSFSLSDIANSEQCYGQKLTTNNRNNKKKQKSENADSVIGPDNQRELEAFERLWLMYPAHRRCSRAAAYEALHHAVARGATVSGIEQALATSLQSYAWMQEGGRFVPSMTTWLATDPWVDASASSSLTEETGGAAWTTF